nr:MAG TPA: hypothetical protein [Caudoviricetes sp.]
MSSRQMAYHTPDISFGGNASLHHLTEIISHRVGIIKAKISSFGNL